MSDLFWCTHCDNAINHSSKSLYCSEQCLRADALRNHPLLGYTYPEFVDFPKPYTKRTPSSIDASSTKNHNRQSSGSIHTVPGLSHHSSCQSSPTLSAFHFADTPPLLQLPAATNKHEVPSILLMGASNATTALSRPSIIDYRPTH